MEADVNKGTVQEGTKVGQTPRMKTTVGKITYLVGVHFKEDGNETMADKIERMIRRDIQSGKCD